MVQDCHSIGGLPTEETELCGIVKRVEVFFNEKLKCVCLQDATTHFMDNIICMESTVESMSSRYDL